MSNFARPGHPCRHNLNTWNMHEWVGLGPSAASQHGGWRSSNPPDLARWHADVAGGRRATVDRVALTNELLAADSVIFGLRMNEGVSLPRLQKRFPTAQWTGVSELWPRLLFEDLLTATPEGRISLTVRGRLVADAIGAEILEAFENAARIRRRNNLDAQSYGISASFHLAAGSMEERHYAAILPRHRGIKPLLQLNTRTGKTVSNRAKSSPFYF